MNTYKIQYKSPYGNGSTIINANCKRDAMLEFNKHSRGYDKEIIKCTNITNNGINEENIMEEQKASERLALIEKRKEKHQKRKNRRNNEQNYIKWKYHKRFRN